MNEQQIEQMQGKSATFEWHGVMGCKPKAEGKPVCPTCDGEGDVMRTVLYPCPDCQPSAPDSEPESDAVTEMIDRARWGFYNPDEIGEAIIDADTMRQAITGANRQIESIRTAYLSQRTAWQTTRMSKNSQIEDMTTLINRQAEENRKLKEENAALNSRINAAKEALVDLQQPVTLIDQLEFRRMVFDVKQE